MGVLVVEGLLSMGPTPSSIRLDKVLQSHLDSSGRQKD